MGRIIGGREHAVPIGRHNALRSWTGEGEYFVGYDPIQVAILDVFEVFVFVDIEQTGRTLCHCRCCIRGISECIGTKIEEMESSCLN
jgi:hypothetical protein